MTKFTPVIHVNNDGTEFFRHDLVEIEFDLFNQRLTRTFNLEDAVSPVMPVVQGGYVDPAYDRPLDLIRWTDSGSQRLWVVDADGGAWVENSLNHLMEPFCLRTLAIFLIQTGNSKAEEVVAVLKQTVEVGRACA